MWKITHTGEIDSKYTSVENEWVQKYQTGCRCAVNASIQ